MSIKVQKLSDLSANDRARIIGRAAAASDSVTIEQQVAAIIASVRKGGDAALLRYTAQFDGVELDSLAVSRAEVQASYAQVDDDLIAALKQAIRNITTFHEAQRANLDTPTVITQPGVAIWRLWRGFDRVGLYVPGGKAIYPSSVLMNGIPARVAGCREIVMCAPPAPNGSLPAPTLVAADLLGITSIFKVGGAQAIAAMAYGTESVPRVNKIYGAGNRYVTAAKMQVWGQVAIDMPAGPTEVMIIADASANPAWVAADLLAQAEHGEDSACLLLTDDTNLACAVATEVEAQLAELATGQRAGVSIARYGAILIVDELRQALDFANEYAPEHLELITEQNDALLPLVRNVGSVFLGPYSPEPTGDYASGSNHVLPTSGYASMFGPLEVSAFGRAIQVQEITAEGLANLRDAVERLATAEGLPGHRNAVSIRFNNAKKPQRGFNNAKSPQRGFGGEC
jgi:histidinol dehydrogenase